MHCACTIVSMCRIYKFMYLWWRIIRLSVLAFISITNSLSVGSAIDTYSNTNKHTHTHCVSLSLSFFFVSIFTANVDRLFKVERTKPSLSRLFGILIYAQLQVRDIQRILLIFTLSQLISHLVCLSLTLTDLLFFGCFFFFLIPQYILLVALQ